MTENEPVPVCSVCGGELLYTAATEGECLAQVAREAELWREFQCGQISICQNGGHS